ncbi:hypothetical protein MKX01_027083 [Papaver californicum]|nr:hypothetical protein MKX01_027083 [Papaver californicum]
MDFSESLNMGSLSNSELKCKSPSSSSSTHGFVVDSKKKKKVFRSRWPGVKKKYTEFTTLCDVDAVLVCNFEGSVYILPGCEDKYQEIVERYNMYDDNQKGKRKRGLDSSAADDDDGVFVMSKKSKNMSISKERFFPSFTEFSSIESLVNIGNKVESVLTLVNNSLNRIHNKDDQMVQTTTSSAFTDDPAVEIDQCTAYLLTHSGDFGFVSDEENQGHLMNGFEDEQQLQHGSTSEYESVGSSSSLLSNDDDAFYDFINCAFDYDQNHNMINELLSCDGGDFQQQYDSQSYLF